MATGFPFNDRRQRPEVMGAAASWSSRAPGDMHRGRPQAEPVAPAPFHQHDPTRVQARGRSYVDIASVTDGPRRPHRDVLG